jgi:hypothetical protein
MGGLYDGVILLPLPECRLFEFSFLFKLLFPYENSKTIGTNKLTKESRQSILVVVVK